VLREQARAGREGRVGGARVRPSPLRALRRASSRTRRGYATRAVDSLRAGVGPDDVSTATALYNLAGLAKRQNKLDVAESSYAEALRIFRLRLGEGQGETADTLYPDGLLLPQAQRLPCARGTYFNQGAEAYARCSGPSTRVTAEAKPRGPWLRRWPGSGRGRAPHHGGGDDD